MVRGTDPQQTTCFSLNRRLATPSYLSLALFEAYLDTNQPTCYTAPITSIHTNTGASLSMTNQPNPSTDLGATMSAPEIKHTPLPWKYLHDKSDYGAGGDDITFGYI